MEATTGKESPYLNYEAAARYCNVHKTTLWRAVRDGRLKARGSGRIVRFRTADLDRYMGVNRESGSQER